MKFFAVFAAILAVGAAFPSSWTLSDLSAALQDPNTDPAVIPILEEALNELYAAIFAGQEVDSILIPVPGIVPAPAPLPVEPALPVLPALPVVQPEPATPFSSPLVQVIVNVNKKTQQIHDIPLPETPAIIGPVEIIDVPNPSPAPAPAPAPVPASPEFNPIDIIAINPEPVGAIDVNPAGDFGPIV